MYPIGNVRLRNRDVKTSLLPMRSDTIWPRILSSFMNVRHFVRLYGLHHASGQPRSFSTHLSHWVHDSQNWPVTSKYLNQWSVDFFSCPLQLHVYTQCFPVLNSCGFFFYHGILKRYRNTKVAAFAKSSFHCTLYNSHFGKLLIITDNFPLDEPVLSSPTPKEKMAISWASSFSSEIINHLPN